ncbi:MAG: SDR family NAD(P)-dependent oxidoreductase [Pseudomonadota bacterium]
MTMRAAVIGASGGIGGALVKALAGRDADVEVHALSRSGGAPLGPSVSHHPIDICDEGSISAAASAIKAASGQLDLVIVATGILSDGETLMPEKAFRDQSMAAFELVFKINTFGPALVAKHFLPLLPRKARGVFAALSARVGSITDNSLGGWHAYRASKTALNMLIKSYALELSRRNDQAICVGLHPGTVATSLSERFTGGIRHDVFTPDTSAGHLLDVIDNLVPDDSGHVLDWKGDRIPA